MGGGHPGLCGSGVSIPALRMGGGQLEVCLVPSFQVTQLLDSISYSQDGREDQEPRAIFSYRARSRLAWAT